MKKQTKAEGIPSGYPVTGERHLPPVLLPGSRAVHDQVVMFRVSVFRDHFTLTKGTGSSCIGELVHLFFNRCMSNNQKPPSSTFPVRE